MDQPWAMGDDEDYELTVCYLTYLDSTRVVTLAYHCVDIGLESHFQGAN